MTQTLSLSSPPQTSNPGLPFEFDWRNPDYPRVLQWRADRLVWMRSRRGRPQRLLEYYRDHLAVFINDWGMTLDPRNVERGLPAAIPFVLFPRQWEWVDWFVARWRAREDGFTEKSRDMGMSWLTVGATTGLCVCYNDLAIGYGSRKQDYVDLRGAPKAFFERLRFYMRALPEEFRAGWTEDCSPHMRTVFPERGSTITGEVGDEIGRGDRAGIYVVDETAFLEHPLTADAALSHTTNCRIDITTPSPDSSAAPVAQRRRRMKPHQLFTYHWTSDPRKDKAWYDKEVEDWGETIVAREIDINWLAAVSGIVIPPQWALAAVDANRKLGIETSGECYAGFDVGDEGDKSCLVGRYGNELQRLESWRGQGSDIFASVVNVFGLCDDWGYHHVDYDADGLGAGVRGDARVTNETRRNVGKSEIIFNPFHGSGEIIDPEAEMVPGRVNKDHFLNLKAQCWYHLRLMFQASWRASNGQEYDRDMVISIDPNLPELDQLLLEISQPTWSRNGVGKVVINKKPDGTASPNHADAVMIAFSPVNRWAEVWEKLA